MTWFTDSLWNEKSTLQLRSIDLHFAAMMTQSLAASDYDRVYLCIVWLSRQLASGHICVNLHQIAQEINGLSREMSTPLQHYIHELVSDRLQLQASLLRCKTVGDGTTITPLILEETRFYLYRMWSDENYIAAYFRSRTGLQSHSDPALPDYLNAIFPATPDLNDQKVAVALAVLQATTIISGGPGTGKTTTVAKLLRVLMQLNRHPLRIVLAAPTGKAASRLTQSLHNALHTLALKDEEQQVFPKEALTLHRLLGASSTGQGFRYHQNNPLHLDVLVVDEASMIDLPLLAALFKALPSNAKLILLGDHDQLASVEAGSVLGDLCYFSRYAYSPECNQRLEAILNCVLPLEETSDRVLSDAICVLRQSYRFAKDSGIAQLAQAVNQGDHVKALRCLQTELAGVAHYSLVTEEGYLRLLKTCVQGYRVYLESIAEQDVAVALQKLSLFQVITPLREGALGVVGLNHAIEKALVENNLIQLTKQSVWYQGRPVMILRNNKQLGLYNGDIGIARRDINGNMRVYFKLSSGEIKGFSPQRLPEHETAFALTIHKSQGSEFGHVVCVLPKEHHALLTKELLYTAITRAQHCFTLFCTSEVFSFAVQRKITRDSGLIHKLDSIRRTS